jgi:hypothetical protein
MKNASRETEFPMQPVQATSALALLIVMLSTSLAGAADVKPGPVPDAPKGWTKKQDETGNTVYRPDNLAAGEDMQVTMLPGEASVGDFRKWFDDKVKSLQTGKTAVRTTDPHYKEVHGVGAYMQAIICKNDNAPATDKANQFLFFTYLAANPAGRAEMIVLSVTSNDLLKKYGAGYKELTDGWAKLRLADNAGNK